MDVQAFLSEIKRSADYADQIVYTREVSAREARFADPAQPLSPRLGGMLASRGIERLYSHQAEAEQREAPIRQGDSLASRARRIKKGRKGR